MVTATMSQFRRRGGAGWTCVIGAILALAGCAGASSRYAGSLTTEQGACGGAGFDAAGKAAATLMIQGDEARFAPTDGVIVLEGHVTGEHVVASSTADGADHKPFRQVFEGDRDGDRVVGRFASPRCRAAVVLTRR